MDTLGAAMIGLLHGSSDSGIQAKPFYADVMIQIIKEPSNKVPTAGVSLRGGRVYLLYNEEFMKALSFKHSIGVLEHETLHLVFDHIGRMGCRDMKVWNVAADCSINQMIDKQLLPKGAVFPESFGFPPNLNADCYYDLLLQKMEQGGGGGKGRGADGEGSGQITITENEDGTYTVEQDGESYKVSPHEWAKDEQGNGGVGSDGVKELQKEVVRQIIQQAAKNQSSRGRGYLPGAVEAMLEEWLGTPTIPWQKMLKLFIGNSVRGNKKRSWKRPNRRFGEKYKGKVSDHVLRLAVAFDTSGSVSDADLKDFFTELKGIQQEYRNEIIIIECDAAVGKTYKLYPYTQIENKVTGRGGTDYEPVFAHIRDGKIAPLPDLLVYLTDLECTFPENNIPCQVLWVCTRDGSIENKPPYGMCVQIKDEAKKV